MKFLALVLVLASPLAYSALDMNPGLWNVEMVVKTNGKEMSPTSEMQKAMANMPEAQRKKMEAMMGNIQPSNKGINVCYSKEMIQKPESMNKQQNKKCDTKIVTNTPKKVATTFKCDDGSKGDATWTMNDKTSFKGLMNLISAKGEKSEMTYNAKFVTWDCGNVKPIL